RGWPTAGLANAGLVRYVGPDHRWHLGERRDAGLPRRYERALRIRRHRNAGVEGLHNRLVGKIPLAVGQYLGPRRPRARTRPSLLAPCESRSARAEGPPRQSARESSRSPLWTLPCRGWTKQPHQSSPLPVDQHRRADGRQVRAYEPNATTIGRTFVRLSADLKRVVTVPS